jgi:NAD(P)-dependent dehydrogenase (short-subunit alcohol dehydrogenase family)
VRYKKVWFITGASRGMGSDFAKAALAAGDAVVASGRDTGRVSKALGHSDDLLPVRVDVTSRADAESAVRAAVARFGRIDVLVNNAASFYAGFFEELTPDVVVPCRVMIDRSKPCLGSGKLQGWRK